MKHLDNLITSGGVVTWINHFSIQVLMRHKIELSAFDLVGIDGSFLRRLVNIRGEHSSADEDIPKFLRGKTLKIGLIGGNFESAKLHKLNFEAKFPNAEVCWSISGFGESLEAKAIELMLNQIPDVVIIGMGAGNQEIEALRVDSLYKNANKKIVAFTCGGWLDQIAYDEYYPKFALKLNLRWLVRLGREPVRLLSRYTLWALLALFRRRQILSYVKGLGAKSFLNEMNEMNSPS
jgi:exopolysaccharide biosynthesis WecB/TagA/CpsF family protein